MSDIVPTTLPKQAPSRHIKAKLEELAQQIVGLGKRIVADVIETGRILTEAKELAGQGNWSLWLKQRFSWSERTARNFMQAYEAFGANPENFADLDIPVSALYLLAAPSTSEPARTEILDRAAKGEKVRYSQAKEAVSRHKEANGKATRPACNGHLNGAATPAVTEKAVNRAPPLNSLSWSDAPLEVRRKWIGDVGAQAIWEAASETQKDAIARLANAWIAQRIPWQAVLDEPFEDHDGIPPFLDRRAKPPVTLDLERNPSGAFDLPPDVETAPVRQRRSRKSKVVVN